MKGENAYELGRPRTRNQWGEFFEKLNEEKKLKRNQFSGLENNDSDVDEVIVVEKERKRHRRSSETKKGSPSDIEFVEDFVKGEREKEKEKEKDKRKCLDLVESDSSDDDVAFIGETFPVCRNKSDMVKVISLDSDTDEKEKEREKEKGKDTGTSSQSLPVNQPRICKKSWLISLQQTLLDLVSKKNFKS